MTQTGTYKPIDANQKELEVTKEMSNMIRPSVDFSTVHYSVTKETLSWVEETILEVRRDEDLPMTVLRPKEKKEQIMRGVNDRIGMDLNSRPDQERFGAIPDDATIKTSQASTAVLRRPSEYQPTEDLDSNPSTLTEEIRPAKIPMAPYEFEMNAGSSVIESEIYAPVRRPDYIEREDHFDELMEENSIMLHRTTGTFNGVYFPCMGIFSSPLYGTNIFPLPPKQEKLHFNLMMNEPTDHYDGNPNSQYEDEIRRIMQPQMLAFEKTSVAFNNQKLLSINLDDWQVKFPFSMVRWGETVAAFSEDSAGGRWFQTVEGNPDLLSQRVDYARVKHGRVQTRHTVTGAHNPPAPVKSKDKLLEKKQQLESQKLKVFIGEVDLRQSEVLNEYERFTNIVREFRIRGGTFKAPLNNIRKVLHLAEHIQQIEDMQRWIVHTQGKFDFHAFHEGWLEGPIMRNRISQTERAKLSTWMLTCLEYHNFMQIRQKVILKVFFRINEIAYLILVCYLNL